MAPEQCKSDSRSPFESIPSKRPRTKPLSRKNYIDPTPVPSIPYPTLYKGFPPMNSLHLLTSLGTPSGLGSFSLMHCAKSTAVCLSHVSNLFV